MTFSNNKFADTIPRCNTFSILGSSSCEMFGKNPGMWEKNATSNECVTTYSCFVDGRFNRQRLVGGGRQRPLEEPRGDHIDARDMLLGDACGLVTSLTFSMVLVHTNALRRRMPVVGAVAFDRGGWGGGWSFHELSWFQLKVQPSQAFFLQCLFQV